MRYKYIIHQLLALDQFRQFWIEGTQRIARLAEGFGILNPPGRRDRHKGDSNI